MKRCGGEQNRTIMSQLLVVVDDDTRFKAICPETNADLLWEDVEIHLGLPLEDQGSSGG